MLWSYALNLTYKRCVPVWLLQPVVFCVINWKFCFCFRHFNLNSPMSTGNWADRTDIFQACVNFLPLYLACPTASLFDLLLFSFTSPEILFPDIFSFYNLVLKKTSQTSLIPPCTVWLLIYVYRSLTSKGVQRETLQEAARSRGHPASTGRRRLELCSSWATPQATSRKWFCTLLTPHACLEGLFCKSLGTHIVCFFSFH